MKAVVTGGAGFIGSHLADQLIKEGNDVLIIDNLISGSMKNIPKEARFIKKDIVSDDLVPDFKDAEVIFHFAADPDVLSSAQNPRKSFEQNVTGTFNVLEACRKSDVKKMVFASTSTVYGNAEIPTPETHPCAPISNYGASKLACEAYVSSYACSYGIKSTILRYANIFGNRSNHGVMFDFFQKLSKDPDHLEILGNGKQNKSYLYISDCVSATLTAFKKQEIIFDVFNVGSREKHTVDEIATLVSKTLDARPETIRGTEDRGWIGDVNVMLLGVSKLEALGWSEKVFFEDGVKTYIQWLKGSISQG